MSGTKPIGCGISGAGDGNRTHATSLEGWSSTIELHPQVSSDPLCQSIKPPPHFLRTRCLGKQQAMRDAAWIILAQCSPPVKRSVNFSFAPGSFPLPSVQTGGAIPNASEESALLKHPACAAALPGALRQRLRTAAKKSPRGTDGPPPRT